jgi:hypothetical protein
MSIGITNDGPNTPSPWVLVNQEEFILAAKRWGDKGEFKPFKPFENLSARSMIQPGK